MVMLFCISASHPGIQLIEERQALAELIDLDELIRLVCLTDRAGANNDRGNTAIDLEYAAFGTVGDLAASWRQDWLELFKHFAIGGVAHGRVGKHLLPVDISLGGNGPHLGQQGGFNISNQRLHVCLSGVLVDATQFEDKATEVWRNV